MRQTKYLIKEAKQNTNTVDTEAISDELCSRLLNRCQDYIMAELYSRNIKTKIFRGTMSLSYVSGTDTYALPEDIYAVNSISSIQQVIGVGANATYSPVRQISEKDRGIKSGYFVTKESIIFSGNYQSSQTMLVSYTKKLPTLSVSYGTVASFDATTITLAAGYTSLTNIDDYFSVVNFSGAVLVDGLTVNQTLGVLTTPTTGVVVGSFVVPGIYASTHSALPNELESTLIFMLEKLIDARLSSSDVKISAILSAEQINQIAEMFSDNSGDSFMPPVLEYTEWA